MAVAKQHHSLLFKRLKKKVRTLQRKEEKSLDKLQVAIKKMRELGHEYKSKLTGNVRLMKAKFAAQGSTYAKVVNEFERHMLKHIAAKGKALSLAVARLEKIYKTQQKKTREIVVKQLPKKSKSLKSRHKKR